MSEFFPLSFGGFKGSLSTLCYILDALKSPVSGRTYFSKVFWSAT